MLKIHTKTQSHMYNSLKNSFKEGIEFRRTPFIDYYNKRIGNIVTDSQATKEIIKGIYKNTHPLTLIKMRASMQEADWERVNTIAAETTYRNKLMQEGRFKLENAFHQGSANPGICLMAWYDALAEHVLGIANSQTGKKAPVPAIQDELNDLSKSLSKNIGFLDAKTHLIDSLKKIYPKTYKTRLKICEQQYNQKVENGITEIVKKIIKGE